MKTLGQIAYESYANYSGWRSLVTGEPLPNWDRLRPSVQGAWQAAARGVAEEMADRP